MLGAPSSLGALTTSLHLSVCCVGVYEVVRYLECAVGIALVGHAALHGRILCVVLFFVSLHATFHWLCTVLIGTVRCSC